MRSISKWLLCLVALVAPIFPQAGPFAITTPPTLPNPTLQSPYEFTLVAQNGFGSLTWSLFSGSILPRGLNLDAGGTITGTPTELGTFAFTVKVEDAQKRSVTAAFTFQVKPAIVVTTPAQISATAGSSLTILLAATGGTPTTLGYFWRLANGSQLPAWLKFDPQNPDLLTGTPPAVGTFSFTVEATDVSQSLPGSKLLTIVVQPALSITTTSPAPSGAVGASYSIQLAATGGNAPYTWTLEPGSALPPGLLLSTAGVVSGSPQVTGVFNFVVRATDAAKAFVTKTVTLAIGPSTGPGVLLSATTLDFTAKAGGDAPPPQNVGLISQAQPLKFTTQGDAPAWLFVRPGNGSTPARIRFSVDQSSLQPGKYTARGQINTSDGRQNSVTVNLTVEAGTPALDVSPTYLRFAGSPSSASTFEQNLVVRNVGGGAPLAFRAAPLPGSPWLSVQPASGQAGPNAPGVLRVIVNTQGRPKGATRGVIRVESSAGNIDVPVSLLVRDDGPVIGLSQDGVRFDVREGNGNTSTRNISVLNLGTGAVNWTAEILPGSSWLSLAAATGSSTPGTPSRLSLSATPGSLTAGKYYGLFRVTAPGALNSPKFLVAVLNVTDAATAPLPDPSPSGLVFIGKTRVTLDPLSATPQPIRLFTSSSTPVPFQASANTTDGAEWLLVTPLSGSTSTATPAQVNVSVANPINLDPGVYTGDVTFAFSSTQIRTVNVTLIVQPSTASSALKTNSAVTGCTPAKLALTQTGLTNSFAAPAGWPTPLIAQLANDCGDPVLNGQVVATFSNGDAPLTMRLTDPASGLYSATWSPGAVTGSMTVTARAFAPTLQSTIADLSGSVTVNKVPSLIPNPVRNNLTEFIEAPLAPGMVAYVKGSALAPSEVSPPVIPLPKTFNGTTVLIGGQAAPLYYLSDGQLNIQIPTELEPGKEYSVLVAANGGYALPDTVLLAPAQPGVVAFNDNGVRRLAAQHNDAVASLVTSASPAKPGEALTIYLIGMGTTDFAVASAEIPPAGTLAKVKDVPTVTIGGKIAPLSYSGLTPAYVGLYQVNLTVPEGVSGEVPVVITQNGVEANPAFLVVQ